MTLKTDTETSNACLVKYAVTFSKVSSSTFGNGSEVHQNKHCWHLRRVSLCQIERESAVLLHLHLINQPVPSVFVHSLTLHMLVDSDPVETIAND